MVHKILKKSKKKSHSAREKIPDNGNEVPGIRTFRDPTLMVYAKRVSGYPVIHPLDWWCKSKLKIRGRGLLYPPVSPPPPFLPPPI